MSGASIPKPPLAKFLILQSVVLLLLSIALFFIDRVTAYSTLFGGLIFIGPYGYFANRAFRYRGASAASDISRSFYQGEAGKFLLTAVLFAGVFALVKPLDVVALFATYCFMVVMSWAFAIRISKT